MESIPNRDQGNHGHVDQGSPIANIVSLESLVNVLIRKGICKPEELFEEERRRRTFAEGFKGISYVKTPETSRDKRRGKQSWLKRKMSKRRWTRRLGTALFGWQWKKVKINRGPRNFEQTPQP